MMLTRPTDLLTLAQDAVRITSHHWRAHGRLPRLWSQTHFTDLIAYRKLFPKPIYGELTDKILVRDFIAKRVGPRHLVPLLASAEDMDGFDFGALPNSFVMKASHGSGWVRLVWDKAAADVEALRREASAWLTQSYHAMFSERQYRGIRPRIVFEELLGEDGEVARDYKVNCFRKGGELTHIFEVHSSRFNGHRAAFLDDNWTPVGLTWGASAALPEDLRKPAEFDEMLAIADALSEGFNHVRVDLYTFRGTVYVGELTFTPGAGLQRFNPPEYDQAWGRLFERERPWQAQAARGDTTASRWRSEGTNSPRPISGSASSSP
jgi:hypothetical protein